jgi:hypothetical protein
MAQVVLKNHRGYRGQSYSMPRGRTRGGAMDLFDPLPSLSNNFRRKEHAWIAVQFIEPSEHIGIQSLFYERAYCATTTKPCSLSYQCCIYIFKSSTLYVSCSLFSFASSPFEGSLSPKQDHSFIRRDSGDLIIRDETPFEKFRLRRVVQQLDIVALNQIQRTNDERHPSSLTDSESCPQLASTCTVLPVRYM